MPIPGHLTKIVWGGSLCSTETWSCSLHYLDPVGAMSDLVSLDALFTTWFTNPNSIINGGATYDYVKANEINPVTGLYASQTTLELVHGPVGPASGALVGPPQLSICVTLRSSIARGYAHAGRFYPPSASPSLLANGTMGATGLGYNLMGTSKTLVEGINALTSGQCVIYSKKGQVANFVTGMQVGQVVDTQRRRRKSIDEGPYATTSISA